MSAASMIIAMLAQGAAAPAEYLLDDYPVARAAYSCRKLRSAYAGACIRVKRSSDASEQDFGFLNDLLDIASIVAWVGSGNNGAVTTWYDQSGNGHHLTQTTDNNMPFVVYSGVASATNGKPTLEKSFFSAMKLNFPASTFTGLTSSTALCVFRQTGSKGAGWANATTSGLDTHTPFSDNNAYEGYLSTSRQAYSAYDTSAGLIATLHTVQNSGTQLSVRRNGVQIGSAASITFTDSPTAKYLFSSGSFCTISEVILSSSNLDTTTLSAIESNMNAYFGLY